MRGAEFVALFTLIGSFVGVLVFLLIPDLQLNGMFGNPGDVIFVGGGMGFVSSILLLYCPGVLLDTE